MNASFPFYHRAATKADILVVKNHSLSGGNGTLWLTKSDTDCTTFMVINATFLHGVAIPYFRTAL
jgi:hypothetical protein